MMAIAISARRSLELSSPGCLSFRPTGRHGSWAPYSQSNVNILPLHLLQLNLSLSLSLWLFAEGVTAHALMYDSSDQYVI